MNYSKCFELLNQDAEKERNKKAEKAVHDNLYNKGFRDGSAVLDRIRAEIERQEKWLMDAGYNAYNVDIAFNAIKHLLTESEVEDGFTN